MGKLPTLVDGATVLAESAAIGLYLADRYSYGSLAPEASDLDRAAYLRWSVYAPAVIEPGCYAQRAQWKYQAAQAGWGSYQDLVKTAEMAIGDGPWLLGQRFTMADVIFGGTVRFMLQFEMIDPRPQLVAYRQRLEARPQFQAAAAKNVAVMQAQGLKQPG